MLSVKRPQQQQHIKVNPGKTLFSNKHQDRGPRIQLWMHILPLYIFQGKTESPKHIEF